MEKRFNYRIYPNKAQEAQIQKNFGCARFVYNYFLDKRNEKYKAGEGGYSFYDACKDLTQLKKQNEYAWLREADAHSLQNALKNMNYAYSEFFRRVREKNGAPGFPKFKSKRETRQSYTSQAQPGGNAIRFEGNRKIRLPKLGLVDCRVSRQTEGRILSASIIQAPSGKYFVSVCCTDIEPKPLAKTGEAVGLHLGIRTLSVASDGRTFDNNRHLEKSQKRISRLQRRVSRKPKDSANREKARIELAKAHERVKNQKTDTLQKLTTELVRDYDTICVRREDMAKMMKQKFFAYHLSDAAWGELASMLRYKCEWYGKTLVEVEPGFPSVQICSSCGHKNAELAKDAAARSKLREWNCPECGSRHERAKNAAMNTLAEGLRQLVAS